MAEGETLEFGVQAMDNDGTASLSIENLPDSNFILTWPGGPDACIFWFEPDYIQAGSYQVRFIAVDDGLVADTQEVVINVAEAGNQAPVWSYTLPDTIDVFPSLLFDTTVLATDPEGGAVTLDATPIIPNATWDTLNSEGTYSFTADVGQVGSVFEILFIATDPLGVADTMITHLAVQSVYLRGDTDANGLYTLNDVVYLSSFIFREGPSPHPVETADVDGSGAVNVSDVVYMVNFLYNAGPRPPQ